ncbi:ribosomal RNA small subunit methyltransferase A [Candidatus Dependentiae bacterium]|nr:ribosomal RNA small subunit methyltransferase A [Candidatus Dependentiae bacterium]
MKKEIKPRRKKALGQHFLRKQSVVDHMIEQVEITPKTSVLEIGCGDGFLTRSILARTSCKKLLVFEIDPEWAEYVRKELPDDRLEIKLANILDIDLSALESRKPWVLLANLPYQITFPIFFLLKKYKDLFVEGVVMVQEEVAQKIVAKRGKPYSVTSIFLQHHFTIKLMEKVEPEAFEPPPKVFSRLLYLKSRYDQPEIIEEEGFWKFVKQCFRFPRQTLRNNLKSTHYSCEKIDPETLKKRAQQLSFDEFLGLWKVVL